MVKKEDRPKPVFNKDEVNVRATLLGSGCTPRRDPYTTPGKRYFRCEAAHLWDHDPNALKKYQK